MKSQKAKLLIIQEMANILGFKISKETPIEPYFLIGVKSGSIKPEQAAKQIIEQNTVSY